MPTGGKKPTGTPKGSTGAKPNVGSDQDFLFTEPSPEQKEDEWLNKIQHLMKIKKNKLDESSKFSENLKRLYEALLKELSMKCEVKYKSMFDIADGGQPDTDMEVNVALRVNTKEKDLLDKLAESSAKYQELTEENNKLKDQLKSYQENLKKFEKQPGDKEVDDYKKEVDAKTVEINKLKQDISEMKKRISETEKQQKLTKPPEKTDDAVNTLNADTLNLQKNVGSDQDFLFNGQSPEQKEDEWLNKIQHLMKIKKNKVDLSDKFSENLKRLYDALLKELSIKCGLKYKSIFDTADDGHSEIEMTMNVTPRDNTKGKVLSNKCSESSAKHQELTEENNKLKDQLKIYQDNLKKFEKQTGDYKKEVDAKTVEIHQLKQDISEMKKRISETEKQHKLTKPPEKTGVDTLNLQIKKFEKQADDYKKEVDAKTAENNQLKQNISEMKKRISEIVNQQKLTKPSEKTDDALHMLKDDTLNLQKKLSSQQQDLQQMQQKIDALTKEKANEKADFLKQKENPEKGLSKEAGMKLTESYPAIADLGDPNRPTRLADKFEELFDNGWTDAMKELANARDEKSNINILKNMVEKSYEFGKTRAANYVKGLEKAFLDVSNSIEITDTISKYIKDQRKNTSLLVLDGLYKSFVSAHTEYNVGGDGVKNFIKEAVSLCWLMAIQDPPMVLTTKLTGKFDTDRFRHYKKSGSRVDYVVWPVLFLHEGGPIMCKGVAQGK